MLLSKQSSKRIKVKRNHAARDLQLPFSQTTLTHSVDLPKTENRLNTFFGLPDISQVIRVRNAVISRDKWEGRKRPFNQLRGIHASTLQSSDSHSTLIEIPNMESDDIFTSRLFRCSLNCIMKEAHNSPTDSSSFSLNIINPMNSVFYWSSLHILAVCWSLALLPFKEVAKENYYRCLISGNFIEMESLVERWSIQEEDTHMLSIREERFLGIQCLANDRRTH